MDHHLNHIYAVIIGAGPAGLTLALSLAQQNIKFLIIDKNNSISPTSRAAVIHARTLEMLEPLGVTETLLAAGEKTRFMCLRECDQELFRMNFSDIPSRYNFALMIPQNLTEKILEQKLLLLGHKVERSTTLRKFTVTKDYITVQIENGSGIRTITTDWIIGCDGYHSTVREQSGIAFEGGDYQGNFILADVEIDWKIPQDEIAAFMAPEGLLFAAPLPGNHYRVIADVETAPESPTLEDIASLLRTRGPQGATVKNLIWSSRFRLHHKLVRSFYKGPVILCGDAAHVHSPAGGQGMNLGIHDAVTLGRIFARLDEDSLADWNISRRNAAAKVVAMTDRMTRMIAIKSKNLKKLRKMAFLGLNHISVFKRFMARTMAQLNLPE